MAFTNFKDRKRLIYFHRAGLTEGTDERFTEQCQSSGSLVAPAE